MLCVYHGDEGGLYLVCDMHLRVYIHYAGMQSGFQWK